MLARLNDCIIGLKGREKKSDEPPEVPPSASGSGSEKNREIARINCDLSLIQKELLRSYPFELKEKYRNLLKNR